MSTPERPLTRRQLKEMRRTGQLPVITPEQAEDDAAKTADVVDAPAQDDAPASEAPLAPEIAPEAQPEPEPETIAASEASPAEPAPEAPAEAEPEPEAPAAPPAAQRPLTRREARLQRQHTSSISVVSSDSAPEGPSSGAGEAEAPAPRSATSSRLPVGFESAVTDEVATAEPENDRVDEKTRETSVGSGDAPAVSKAPSRTPPVSSGTPKVGASFGAAVFDQAEDRQRQEREEAEREAAARREAKEREEAERPSVESDASTDLATHPAIHRSHDSGGSSAGATALILNDLPSTAALSAPITATGELILTSSHTLPDGLASRGAASGTTDGKEIDATLLDGEIPMHSSPTPIAASSAVSTSKAPGDVIRPPSKEKNQGLMLTLGITAGVLGVALVGVVIYAFATGVFG